MGYGKFRLWVENGELKCTLPFTAATENRSFYRNTETFNECCQMHDDYITTKHWIKTNFDGYYHLLYFANIFAGPDIGTKYIKHAKAKFMVHKLTYDTSTISNPSYDFISIFGDNTFIISLWDNNFNFEGLSNRNDDRLFSIPFTEQDHMIELEINLLEESNKYKFDLILNNQILDPVYIGRNNKGSRSLQILSSTRNTIYMTTDLYYIEIESDCFDTDTYPELKYFPNTDVSTNNDTKRIVYDNDNPLTNSIKVYMFG